jgi:energy-coupling factor transporter ATP-binding protein EcfA2
MKLIDLDIQRIPGFEREGFSYQNLREGVHVIWGPNGSGKSTTCRAIQALLWPQRSSKLDPLLLQSHWEWGKEKIFISREGSRSAIPEMLKAHLDIASPHAYFFSLDDLFDEREKDLAKILSNEMHGGYDFSELRKKFEIPPRFGALEASQISHLGKELEKVGREQARIVENQEDLTKIDEEIVRAQAANEQLDQLESAIECIKLKQSIEQICLPTKKKSSFDNRLGCLLFALLAIVLFFIEWFLALLPTAATLYFLRRYLDKLDQEKKEENSLNQKKIYFEGRLSQAILDLEEEKLLNSSLEDLEENRRLLSNVAANLESLLEQKRKIERDVQIALTAKNFDHVNVKIQTAKDSFEKKRQEAKKLLLGRAFLKRIEERFEQERQPLVLQRAAEYFNRFSFGTYTLQTLKQEIFRVWDVKRDRHAKLSELSYGLRVQLLLALRLGFLSSAEEETLKLPLFMDEVLCHVDDDRFSNVAEAIIEIGKERQVFLFTCQRWSFECWKNLGAYPIDLEEIQYKKRIQRSPIRFSSKSRLLREPYFGEEIISYAQDIGLHFPNLSLKFFDQPSWVVLDSSQEVYRIYSLGIKTIGHLLTLPCSDTVREKCNVLKKALELASIGRTSPVCRNDLENAVEQGVFSKTFLDSLNECSKRVNGDARSLLEALKKREVKRFLSKYVENLEKFFLEKGLLDLREALSEDEIRKQLYQAVTLQSQEVIEFITYILSLFIVANKSDGMSQSCP